MSYAMALDNSWDILSEEEMYEVNGGFWWGNGVSRYWTGVAIDVSIIAFGIGLAAKNFMQGIKMLKNNRTYVRTAINKFVKAAGYGLGTALLDGLMFVIGKISNISSIGQLIAHGLDFADKDYDGRIKF